MNPASSGWANGDTRPGGAAFFSTEFGAPSGFGDGALKMTTAGGNGAAKVQYFKGPTAIPLADVEDVAFRSFRSSQSTGNPIHAPSAQFYLDPDGAGPLTFAPLVFEPYYSYGAPAVDTWQTWDGVGDGSVQWWSNRAIGNLPSFSFVPLSQYQAAAPDALITSFGFNLGSGNPGIVAAVDGLEITTADTTTYDFEPFAAGPVVVDDDGAGVAGNCDDPTPAFSTIQSAVDFATAGDTIKVCAGTYNENVTAGKQLTFLGAQAGNDARVGRTAPSGESVINGTLIANGTSGTRIDGFWFTAPTQVTVIGLVGGSGHTVVNNVVTGIHGPIDPDTQLAIVYTSDGTLPSLFQHNRITDNDANGIFGFTPVTNVTIDENAFARNTSAAVNVGAAGTGVVVSDNTSTQDTNFFVGTGSTGLVINNNTVTGTQFTSMLFGGDFADLSVTHNTITGGGGSGVSFTTDFSAVPSTSATITENTITGNLRGISFGSNAYTGSAQVHFNRIVDNGPIGARLGIRNLSAGAVNAEDNWFGCNEGTTGADCDKDTGTVDTTPFLVLNVSVSPPQVVTTSTVTADLTRNSADVDRSAAGTIPATPVTFAATKGQLGATSGTLVNGKATTTITGAGATGSGTVSATVDHETVSTAVSFITPKLSIDDVTVPEAGGLAVFTVSLDMPSQDPVTFNYTTLSGTAAGGADYTSITSTGVIPAGQTTLNISVPIAQDTLDEIDETFTVVLSTASVGIMDGTGVAKITDDDAAPTVSTADAVPVVEGANASFVLTLSAPSGKAITVRVTTRNGTAVAPRDYDADGAAAIVTFAPGETTKTLLVKTNLDTTQEPREQFQFGTYQPVNVTIVDRIGVGTIKPNNT